MPADIPTTEPTEIIAGDTLSWSKTLDDYPADDSWVLTYYLRGPASYTITTTADGSDHVAAESAATTALWVTGDYLLMGFVSLGSTRYKVHESKVTVFMDVVSMEGPTEIRSDARIIYDSLIALQKQRATRPEMQMSTQAVGRTLVYKSDEDLQKAIDYWGAKCLAEEEQEAGGPNSTIVVRFRDE